jgi:hypothetical protein
MLVLSAASGLCAAWWLFPVGLLVWVLMVTIHARDPHLHLSLVLAGRGGLAQRLRRLFDPIERVQVSLYNALISTNPRTRKAIKPAQDAINRAVERVYGFCLRLTAVENHRLVEQSRSRAAEVEVLKANIEKALDPRVRAEYEDNLVAIEKRLESLRRTSDFMNRVEAELSSISANLENIQTQILHLQVLDPSQAAPEITALVPQITACTESLATFERELTSLGRTST